MTIHETLQHGTATVSGDVDFSDGPWTVHGVAQASEVTRGVSGERRFWPPAVLRDAAEKLVGTPVVSPEDHEDLTPGQPDPRTIIGEVTDAAFDADREALVYEAELDDPEFAKLASRGRIDVSPSVALREGDRDEQRDANRVAEVLDYRDLAAVTDGAHASASINLGTAEALARHFDADALQSPEEANAVDVDVSPPEAVVNAAEAALEAKAEVGAIGDCGTGVGESRAEQIVNGDLEPADFVTRNNDRTPIPAYLTSHAEDVEGIDETPPNWSEETWTDGCGPVQYALWGGTATGTGLSWAQRTANEILAALDEPPAYENLRRERARTPTYSDTEDAEWNTPTLEDYLQGYDSLPAADDVDSVDELAQSARSFIAEKSLLGTPSGETLREVRFFPVVDPETDALNRRALGAVRSGRGEAADIPSDALASAQRMAGELLVEEFDSEIDSEATANHRGGDDGPDGDSDPSTSARDWRQTMADDLTDKEHELLSVARQKDDPAVVEAEVPERLTELEAQHDEYEAVIEAASEYDDPTVVGSDDYEALSERVDIVEGMMADALQERTGLSDAAVDAMPFEAMAAEFETDDGDLDIEALTQSPETGSGPTDDDPSGPDEEALERIDEIKTKLDHAEAALPDARVEALREEAATLADADDYDAALEVL